MFWSRVEACLVEEKWVGYSGGLRPRVGNVGLSVPEQSHGRVGRRMEARATLAIAERYGKEFRIRQRGRGLVIGRELK